MGTRTLLRAALWSLTLRQLSPAEGAWSPREPRACPHFHALIQRASGLSKLLATQDSTWDDRSIFFHEGCPWLYEAHEAACPEHGPCTRTLECRMSRPLRIGAIAVPALAVTLALLAMMCRPKDSDLAKPIDWSLNRLPFSLTPLVRRWFGTGVFPPTVGTRSPPAPEVFVALYLVGLLGWLFLMHGVKYTQPTPLDVPEYLDRVANACLAGSAACGHGSSPEKAGFKVIPGTGGGAPLLAAPYPTWLLLGGRQVPLAHDVGGTAWTGVAILVAVRLTAFIGIMSTIFALLLSRLCRGNTVTVLRIIAAVGSSVFCLAFAALEAAVRWHGHLWIAPAFANFGIATFCLFLAAGVDATHFLARWAFYCTLVPLYFTAGCHKLKVGGLDWNACTQISRWAQEEFHWNIPMPDFTRFILSHDYVCIALTASTLSLQIGIGLAEILPWLVRPLLPLAALSFHVGVWLMMHICFGGHAWVWVLCVDVIQPTLRCLVGPSTPSKAADFLPKEPKSSPETSDGESVSSLETSSEMRPKATAAAAFCTVASLAVFIRGCISTWVPWEDTEQWPFTSMDMFP